MLNSQVQVQRKYSKKLRKKKRIYKFHKYKKIRLQRRLLKILITSIMLITLFVTFKALYIRSKCKDIYYSIDYYMTSSYSKDNRLLRVKEMNVLYSDDKTAVVLASGLDDKSPHKYLTYRVSLSKTEKKYWKLENIASVD